MSLQSNFNSAVMVGLGAKFASKSKINTEDQIRTKIKLQQELKQRREQLKASEGGTINTIINNAKIGSISNKIKEINKTLSVERKTQKEYEKFKKSTILKSGDKKKEEPISIGGGAVTDPALIKKIKEAMKQGG